MIPYDTAVRQALTILERRWTLIIILTLLTLEKEGFNRLKKKIKPISSRTLSQRLKELESLRLISKHILLEFPRRVEYQLTEEGKRLGQVLLHIVRGPN